MKKSLLGANGPVDCRRLSIGIVATEFPPMVGGMEQHALGLVSELSKSDSVTVFTHIRNETEWNGVKFEVKPVLLCALSHDAKILRWEDVDVWLTLNAGYSMLAKSLKTPLFAYCHGNDFLNPWVRQPGLYWSLCDLLEQAPYCWRLAPKARTAARLREHERLIQGLCRAQAVFVNSQFTKRRLLTAYPRLKRPIIVSNPGVSDHFFIRRNADDSMRAADPARLQLLTIARLATVAPKKNVDNVLRALALLQNEILISYTIVGDGDRRAELEMLSNLLGLAGSVRFTGTVANEEIPSMIDQADLFVLASRASDNDVESFGIVYAEAAARGVPSLMSRMGGATDAVEDGVSGIIIDGAEPHHIAEGIRRFWQTRQSFKPERIRAFAERFRWPVVATQMRDTMVAALES